MCYYSCLWSSCFSALAARPMTMSGDLGLLGTKRPLEALPWAIVTLQYLILTQKEQLETHLIAWSIETFKPQLWPSSFRIPNPSMALHLLWIKSKFLITAYKNLLHSTAFFCLISVCIHSQLLGAADVKPRRAFACTFFFFLRVMFYSVDILRISSPGCTIFIFIAYP